MNIWIVPDDEVGPKPTPDEQAQLERAVDELRRRLADRSL